jgi:hypothetical protein
MTNDGQTEDPLRAVFTDRLASQDLAESQPVTYDRPASGCGSSTRILVRAPSTTWIMSRVTGFRPRPLPVNAILLVFCG